MEKKLSRFLSVLFHPLLMPTYGVFIYFFLQLKMGLNYPANVKYFVILFVFLTTFAIPLLLTFFMLRFKLINSFEMKTQSERIIPLFITAILFYITYYSLNDIGFFVDLQLFILGSTVLVLLTVFINYFTKISIHMVGIGGVSGAVIALGVSYKIDVVYLLNLIIIISGLLGYARLKLGAHRQFQIYAGYITGLAVMLGLFLIY